MQAVNKAIIQQQSYVTNNRYFKAGDKKSEDYPQQQVNSIKNKLFGRSSYHVAIAYHIHLKKIYETGG